MDAMLQSVKDSYVKSFVKLLYVTASYVIISLSVATVAKFTGNAEQVSVKLRNY